MNNLTRELFLTSGSGLQFSEEIPFKQSKNLEKNREMSSNKFHEEVWLKTTIELDSAVFELAQDLETTTLQLKTTEDKYLKLENEFTNKETEWIVGNNTLRGKLRQIEEQKLRQKIEYEEKFKGKVLLIKSCCGIFLRNIVTETKIYPDLG